MNNVEYEIYSSKQITRIRGFISNIIRLLNLKKKTKPTQFFLLLENISIYYKP